VARRSRRRDAYRRRARRSYCVLAVHARPAAATAASDCSAEHDRTTGEPGQTAAAPRGSIPGVIAPG
jgi:hypothetical protein